MIPDGTSMMRFRSLNTGMIIVFLTIAPTLGARQNQAPDGELLQRARAIHERVIVLDSHVDINPVTFTTERNYTQELPIQVDLPKMVAGGMDAAFFVVYTRQGGLTTDGYARAWADAVEKFDAIHRLTDEYAPDRIELARTAADVRRIHAEGRKAALIGVENAFPLGEDIGRVEEFFDRGARYMSLAHNRPSQFADSNTGEEDGHFPHGGLSAAGRMVLAELNRLGIVVDVSHLSRDAMMEAVGLSRAPVMASHSAVRALVDHPRNLDDEQLVAIRDSGGVVQVVAYPEFVKVRESPSVERAARDAEIRREAGLPLASEPDYARRFDAVWSELSPEERAAYLDARRVMNAELPTDPPASVADFVDHIDYAVGLIGIDHVGIASDFNNGEGVTGWFDASETLNVTVELVRRGYTEEDIGRLWSGNLLRVMEDVRRVALEGTEN